MSSYQNPYQQPYSTSGGGMGAPQAQKNSFRKGLGFVPNSIEKSEKDPIAQLIHSAPPTAMGQSACSNDSDLLESTIPLFKVEAIAHAQGKDRERRFHAFGRALMRSGFIGVSAPQVQSLTDAVYKEMNHYFHLSLQTKLLDWKKDSFQRGFSYCGSERGPKAPSPDFKESFFIPSDFQEWPRHSRSFSRVMSDYRIAVVEIYQTLMGLIMEFLGHCNEQREGGGNHLLRLAYYPPFKPNDDSQGVWLYPHRDKSTLSILSKATAPGLQYYSAKGLWEPVVVPEGYLIISSGLLLQHKTAGLFKSRWHRVINPGGQYTHRQRLSAVFYGSWPDPFSLKPFTDCEKNATENMSPARKRAYLKKFCDTTVGEKLYR